MSVYLCVFVSVYISVQAITFEFLYIETSFLVYRYIFTISRYQSHMRKTVSFTYFNMLIFYIFYRSLIWSRSHIKFKVTSMLKEKYLPPSNFT